MEIWKEVLNFEGIYEASNLGRVKSLVFRGKPRVRILNQFLVRGYLYVSFNKKPIGVHRIVAMAFLNHNLSKGKKIVVDHIDNNKGNNTLSNLQIITARQNTSKDRTGTSIYTGVYWSNGDKAWVSEIQIEGVPYTIGRHEIEIEADKAYQKALNDWIEKRIKPKKRITTSKYIGVSWIENKSKWYTYFTVNSKKYYAGYYDNEYEAHLARENYKLEIEGLRS